VEQQRKVVEMLDDLKATMPAEFWRRPEVKALTAQLAEVSEATVRALTVPSVPARAGSG
jgi:hypothetical protein